MISSSPFYSRTHLRTDPHWSICGFVIILLFLWSNGAGLKLFEISADYVNAMRLASVCVILVIAVVFWKQSLQRGLLKDYYFWAIVSLILAVMLPTFVTSVLGNGQALVEVFRLPMMYYAMFSFVSLYAWGGGWRLNRFFDAIALGLALIVSVYVIVSLVPGLAESALSANTAIGDRFGRDRLSASAGVNNLAVFAFLYLVVKLLRQRLTLLRRLAWFIPLGIISYYIFFVLMSRTRIIASLISLLFLIPHVRWRRIAVPMLAMMIMGCTLLWVFDMDPASGATSIVDSMVNKHSSEQDTISIRKDGFNYYRKSFEATGYVGIGLVSRARDDTSDAGFAMAKLSYNPSDLGLAAVLFFFGFPGLILTGAIVFRMFRDTTWVIRHSEESDQIPALSLRLYLIFYMFSFYHFFLYDEYAMEWGLLFFAASRMAASRSNKALVYPDGLRGIFT